MSFSATPFKKHIHELEGVFSGRIARLTPEGHAVIHPFTGAKAILPARLVNGHKVGDELRYRARNGITHDDAGRPVACAFVVITRIER